MKKGESAALLPRVPGRGNVSVVVPEVVRYLFDGAKLLAECCT